MEKYYRERLGEGLEFRKLSINDLHVSPNTRLLIVEVAEIYQRAMEKYLVKHFTCIISFSPQSNPVG